MCLAYCPTCDRVIVQYEDCGRADAAARRHAQVLMNAQTDVDGSIASSPDRARLVAEEIACLAEEGIRVRFRVTCVSALGD